MNWKKWSLLWPSRRRREELDMREELNSLAQFAPPRELGNLTLAAENARETWGWTWLESIVADLRYAVRALRRQPGFLAVAVVSLALGIGANSAIFSLADALLLRPLPVLRPAEVLTLSNTTPDNPFEGMSYPDYRDIRQQCRSFSGLIAYRMAPLGVAAVPSAPPQMRLALMASDNFFGVLGIVSPVGRSFLPDEAITPGRDRIAILGYDFWDSQYGRDRSVVGRTLRLNGIDFTIVGVAPESFPGIDRWVRPSLFVPLSMWGALAGESQEPLEDRARHELSVKGRLAAAASRQSAQAELSAIGLNLARAYPRTNRNRQIAVRTEIQAHVQQVPQHLVMVTMLMILVGLVLTIACANVANLSLARGRARSREIAIRLAIGAGRSRLVRQLMTESLVVALLGGAAGLAVGYGGIRFLGTMQIPGDIPVTFGVQIDTRVLVYTLFAALASCLLFGLAPALQAGRVQLVPALKAGGEATHPRRRLLGRNVLVVGQVAFAMVLLIATSGFLGGFRKLVTADPGFQRDHRISMDLDPSVRRYPPAQTHDFYRQLVDRARALPGVVSVSLAASLPFSLSQSSLSVIPEGYAFPKGREIVTVLGGAFDENYFATMKIPMARGRGFSRDDRMGSRRVAIVNEEFAKTYWPNQDPIGKRLRLDRADGPIAEVVGITKTGRYYFPTESPTPYVYLPYEQNQNARMTLIAESRGDPAALAAPLREVVRSLDVDQPIQNLRTVTSFYEHRVVSNFLILLEMVAIMGLVGLTLAIVGLYGLVSYSVSCRTREIGVRMAIGASRASVLRFVLRQGLTLAAAGIAIGGILTAVLVPARAPGMELIWAVSAATFLIVPIALFAVSVAACYLPARRAANLDPIRALRWE
ncbi:MAG: ABC transporter permease [Candidatus Solibacter sp.]|jgi:putative ABC transport system permease protein